MTSENESGGWPLTSPKTPVSSNRRNSLSGIQVVKNGILSSAPAAGSSSSKRTVHFHGDDSKSSSSDTENVPPPKLACVQQPTEPTTTTLFHLIKQKEWDRVLRRCEECPSEASVWIVEDNNYDGSIRWRLLPIHQACEERPPDTVISALLKANPRSALERDMGGSLPIHLACRERAHKSVADVLLHHCRKCIDCSDNEGRLPLHLACRQGVSSDMIDLLLRPYYRGAMQQDADGMLPLHWACAQGASCPIVESLLRAYPDSVNVMDKLSRTPLTILQSSSHPEKEAVLIALKRDISYWTTSLQDEVSNLKTLLAHSASEEKSLREELAELRHRFDQVDIHLEQCVKDKIALETANRSLHDQCAETTLQNEVLQSTNKKLQVKVKEHAKVLALMKKEQATVRAALMSMMGARKNISGPVVLSNAVEDMRNILTENRSDSFDDSEEEDCRFAEI